MNYLIAGLGNIGQEYAETRHNMGFMVLDAWTRASNIPFINGRYGSTAEIKYKGHKLTLLKPSTYMNLSGKAVHYWMQKLKIPVENLLVVVDDLSLEFGMIRMRKKGSDGGHNGLKSIDYSLCTNEYARLRIGIGNGFAPGGQINFVLGELMLEEKRILPLLFEKTEAAIKSFAAEGIDNAMNKFNHSSPLLSSEKSEKEE